MNFGEAVVSGLRNYINFSGRASRSEFWFFTLFFNLVLIGIGATTDFLHSNPVARERFGWLAGLIFSLCCCQQSPSRSGACMTSIEPAGGF